MTDLIADSGYLFLGSRLKRLAEQMQGDVNQLSQSAGMAIPAGKHPLLAILSQCGPQTVGQLSRAMGQSQPVTTRGIGALAGLDLVKTGRSSADGRSRIVSLTAAGERAVARVRETVWPLAEAAVREIAEGLRGSLLEQIAAIERALAERSLAQRAASIAASELSPAVETDLPGVVGLMNRAYRGSGTSSGWTTEAGYITGDRITEPLLRADLAAKPAASFLLWRDSREGTSKPPKGCVWLEPVGGDTWYLGSLAVEPARQNSGLGHALLLSAEHWVRERGARRIRMTVVNVRTSLIAWYGRRGYRETGRTEPFPYDDERFGRPQRDDLCFVVLEKDFDVSEEFTSGTITDDSPPRSPVAA